MNMSCLASLQKTDIDHILWKPISYYWLTRLFLFSDKNPDSTCLRSLPMPFILKNFVSDLRMLWTNITLPAVSRLNSFLYLV